MLSLLRGLHNKFQQALVVTAKMSHAVIARASSGLLADVHEQVFRGRDTTETYEHTHRNTDQLPFQIGSTRDLG